MLQLFPGSTTCLLDKEFREFRSVDFFSRLWASWSFISPGSSGIYFFAWTFKSKGNSFLFFLLYEGPLMHLSILHCLKLFGILVILVWPRFQILLFLSRFCSCLSLGPWILTFSILHFHQESKKVFVFKRCNILRLLFWISFFQNNYLSFVLKS